MEKFISGKCPHCMTILHINEGDSVSCPSCDNIVSSDEIKIKVENIEENSVGQTKNVAANYAQGINSPESGLAYFDNLNETYNWQDYELQADFEIDGIDSVVEKVKVTCASNPKTWYLEFSYISVCLAHKVKGLFKLLKEIETLYDPDDMTNAFKSFDDYQELSISLVNLKNSYFKKLDSDIKFMEKFDMESEQIASIKEKYAKLQNTVNNIQIVSNLEDLSCIKKLIAANEEDIVEYLESKSISAPDLYNEAVELYNQNNNRAIDKFEQLVGYKDTKKYINKLNSLTVFNNLVEWNKNIYYLKQDNTQSAFNPLAKSGANANSTGAYTLHSIQDGKVNLKSSLAKEITSILTVYNGKLFYIKNNKEICVLDLFTKETKCLASQNGMFSEIVEGKMFALSRDKKTMFLKKMLIFENKGCSLKANNDEQKNNFTLLKINLVTLEVSIIIGKIVDVMDIFDDYLFFSQYKGEKITFNYLNFNTGKSETLLDEHAYLIGVYKDNIVYSRYNPSTFNMDLYSLNIEEKKACLIEKNIYDVYPEIHDGKVLYSVGSFERRSMFSRNLDGSNRTEILLNVENIEFFDRNWIYVTKGYGYNKTLIKISYDGLDKIVICSGVKEIVKLNACYIYYISYFNNLCIVRNDGNNFKILAPNCVSKSDCIIDSKSIYLIRNEFMDNRRKVVEKSLYRMDHEGHNLKKFIYHVTSIKRVDDNVIFALQSKERKYKIKYIQKGKMVDSVSSNLVNSYFEINEETNKFTKILDYGIPFEINQPGCLGKEKKIKIEHIEEIIDEAPYTRQGKFRAGEVEEILTLNNQLVQTGCANKNNSNNQNSGCLVSSNKQEKQGCANKNNLNNSINRKKISFKKKEHIKSNSNSNKSKKILCILTFIFGLLAFLMFFIPNVYDGYRSLTGVQLSFGYTRYYYYSYDIYKSETVDGVFLIFIAYLLPAIVAIISMINLFIKKNSKIFGIIKSCLFFVSIIILTLLLIAYYYETIEIGLILAIIFTLCGLITSIISIIKSKK